MHTKYGDLRFFLQAYLQWEPLESLYKICQNFTNVHWKSLKNQGDYYPNSNELKQTENRDE